MKKKHAIYVTLATVATVASCFVRNQGTFTVPSGGYDGSAQTVKFYTTMGSNLTPVLDKYIAKFNEEYPNITVEYTSIGGWDDVRDQCLTELTVGAEPNVAYCYPDHVAAYNIARKVVTLDGLIKDKTLGFTTAQENDFIEGYYSEGRQFGDGLMYTLPFSKSTELLYYNETFFKANNIKVPDHWFSKGANDETSMEYVCAKIKSIDPTSIPLGYDSEGNWFITMCEQLGSGYTSASDEEHFLFNNDTNKDFVKKFNGWYKNGWVTTATLYGAYTSGLFVAQSGTRSYMSIGSSAGATYQRPSKVDGQYPFNVGITSIPQVDPSNPKVISQGPSICLFTKEDPQAVVATWLFAKYFTTSAEFQAEFSMESGYVPVLKSVSDIPAYKDFLNNANGGDGIAALSAKMCLEQGNAYFTSPAFVGSTDARTQVGNLLVAALGSKLEGAELDAYLDQLFQDAYDECSYAI